jgi:hypothetical protein
MNKAFRISAVIALGFSGAAFAQSSSQSSSASRTAGTAASSEITEADCQMLRVESARSACLQYVHGGTGAAMRTNTGSTQATGSGATGGSNKAKRSHKRAKHTAAKRSTSGGAGGDTAR